jgi:hypothetical protein
MLPNTLRMRRFAVGLSPPRLFARSSIALVAMWDFAS